MKAPRKTVPFSQPFDKYSLQLIAIIIESILKCIFVILRQFVKFQYWFDQFGHCGSSIGIDNC